MTYRGIVTVMLYHVIIQLQVWMNVHVHVHVGWQLKSQNVFMLSTSDRLL